MDGVPWLLRAERLELSDTLLAEFYQGWDYIARRLHTASAKVDELQRTAFTGKTDGGAADEMYEDEAEEVEQAEARLEDVAKEAAIERLKFISDMGLMKIATQKMEHEQRVQKRAAGETIEAGRWSQDVYSASVAGEGIVNDEQRAELHTKQALKVERMVQNGARDLGGEIEALRGHYAALVMADNWDPQTHEDIALGLDAVAEAARRLQVPAIEQDAQSVALGVREMAGKVAHLGSALL